MPVPLPLPSGLKYMWLAAAGLVFLLPLAFAPGYFFYYDVTPKACVLYVGAALLVGLCWTRAAELRAAFSTGPGKIYIWLLAGLAGTSILATIFSPYPHLAWTGSTWRRGGAITEVTIFVASALVAVCPVGLILRALCCAGIFTSAYGIVQYFGWDPWIAKSAYIAGEEIYEIVRPPSTLGHSDYFAVFLLWPIFAGAGLWMMKRSRWVGAMACMTGCVAVILSGSRGAVLGLIVGGILLLFFRRPSARMAVGTAAVAIIALGAFVASPAGARLRARAFWISEDPFGGARLLLWRDSLRMATSRPLLGFGPDTFGAAFPAFQSLELARAYPDFSHESPHNLFLDSLVEKGIVGLILLAAICTVGVLCGWRARGDPDTAAMFAALIAFLVAQQFVVWTIPTALLLYSGLGWQLPRGKLPLSEPPASLRITLGIGGMALVAVFLWAAHRVGSGDRALLQTQFALTSGETAPVAREWERMRAHRDTGVTADIELSRLALKKAAETAELPAKLFFSQLAREAAEAAVFEPENRSAAWYNLAILQAASNDTKGVEASLRSASKSAPHWYKPHWMLARVLKTDGRTQEARAEATQALDLDRGLHPEVTETLQNIGRSAASDR